jgi:prephenate dehydrogenase
VLHDGRRLSNAKHQHWEHWTVGAGADYQIHLPANKNAADQQSNCRAASYDRQDRFLRYACPGPLMDNVAVLGAAARASAELGAKLRTVAVVGTGAIGTSVALALSRRGVRTYLLDRDPDAASMASRCAAGTVGVPTKPVDLAVLAVPPYSIAETLAEYQAQELARCYTDVASVKSAPLSRARELGCDMTTYVGGHPIAGSERSGPTAATETLFRDRMWVLTPLPDTATATVAAACELIRLCDARPILLDHNRHDRLVARTSHVPHLVAAALAATLDDAEETELRLCGAGIRDATRIAAGGPELWADILRSNAVEVVEALGPIIAALTAASQALTTLDAGTGISDDLMELLVRGNTGRAALTERQAESAPTNKVDGER